MMAAATSSLRTKLLALSVLTASTSLVLACGAFLAYDVINFRDSMVRNLTTHADIIARNSAAAVLFQDPRSAAETLSALRAEPHITFAEIRTPDGRSFARYQRGDPPGGSPANSVPLAGSEMHRFEADRLVLSRPIVSETSEVARLQLHSDLRARSERIQRYLLIAGGILAISLVAGLLIATRLQQRISASIKTLVGAARSVSEEKNYSIRVDGGESAEIALLARTFNEMLEQIERQDAELRQAVKARDEFLSIASHELKTPLTPLQLQVESLQNVARRQPQAPGTTRLINGLEMADRQVARLTTLVNNLLDISRITSHRLRLDYEMLDLSALVREVVARFQQELSRAGCPVTVEAPRPVVGAWDRMRLEQVVSNFLSNAAKYGAGKPIEIAVEALPDAALFRIQDHGIGIAPDDQARIFQRFERAVSEHNYGGFGLGLWIVRQIVDALGGTVNVQSVPGEGATFSVTLPLKRIATIPSFDRDQEVQQSNS